MIFQYYVMTVENGVGNQNCFSIHLNWRKSRRLYQLKFRWARREANDKWLSLSLSHTPTHSTVHLVGSQSTSSWHVDQASKPHSLRLHGISDWLNPLFIYYSSTYFTNVLNINYNHQGFFVGISYSIFKTLSHPLSLTLSLKWAVWGRWRQNYLQGSGFILEMKNSSVITW